MRARGLEDDADELERVGLVVDDEDVHTGEVRRVGRELGLFARLGRRADG